MAEGNKNNNNSDIKNVIKGKFTLPWLIVTIVSMVSFLAFLISLYFGWYTGVFFGILIISVAAILILDGIHKKKEQYVSGNLNFIMAVLCIVAAVLFITK